MTTTRRHFLLSVGLTAVVPRRTPAAAPTPRRDYRAAMRAFVRSVSAEARRQRPGFLVVPQGGLELRTADGEPGGPPAADYLAAIDGVGQEVFYGYENRDGRKTPPKVTDTLPKRLAVARTARKAALSIDYAKKQAQVADALARNAAAGLIPFVADRRGLDRVPAYPLRPVGEHAGDVTTFADTKNFLYLIDGGKYRSVKKYLAAVAGTNYDLLVIDPLAGD